MSNNELTKEQEIQISRDKAIRNKVLDEVLREVEKEKITADEIYNHRGTDGWGEYAQGNNLLVQKLSTIIDQLKLK